MRSTPNSSKHDCVAKYDFELRDTASNARDTARATSARIDACCAAPPAAANASAQNSCSVQFVGGAVPSPSGAGCAQLLVTCAALSSISVSVQALVADITITSSFTQTFSAAGAPTTRT